MARESVYRWVESRGLPAHRVGRLLRFRLSEIDAWVAGQAESGQATRPWAPTGLTVRESVPAASRLPGESTDERTRGESNNQWVREAIQEMVRRIVERFDPEHIVLFGSHAWGNAGPDSDVDLLVVMPVTVSKRGMQVEIRLALHDIPLPKDIIVATPEEMERYQDIVGTIIRPALREGKTLYERAT